MSKLKFSALHIAIGSTLLSGLSFNVNAENKGLDQVERIEVTGSKIKRVGVTSPTPITVITGADLIQAGVTNINDLLSELPAGEAGLNPDSSNGYIYANGLNTYDLRGLGSGRTLVLVNGKRFVGAGPTNPAVDLNNIPASMIKRVEVITGGASAVYGADAVAGVVNIITKTSHDGVTVQLDTSKPQQTGGEKHAISIVGGYDSGNLNIVSSVEFTENKGLRKLDRDFFRNPVESHFNPSNTSSNDLVPRRISHNNGEGYGLYAPQGNFMLGSTRDAWALDNRNYTFNEDGSLRDFDYGLGRLYDHPNESPSLNYISDKDNLGDGIPHGGTNGYQYFNSPLERLNLGTSLSYDFSEDHKLTSSIFYSKTKGTGLSSPTFHRHTITTDNAYMSDEMKTLLANNTTEDGEADARNSVTLFQMTDAFGNREYVQSREALNLSLGLEGYINEDWAYSVYAQHGENENNSRWHGEVYTQNLRNAVDAVEFGGEIVCANRDADGNVIGAIEGCTPLNVMNLQSLTQEQSDYITTVAANDRSSEMYAFGATIDGTLYELPAGYIATALTLEHRNLVAKTRPSKDMEDGLIFGNSSLPMDGEVSVTEVAAEFSIPLLAEHEWAKSLTLDVALRYMDYDVTGSDEAWKLGINYEINDDVKFRATRSKSVRAPDLGDLFNASSTTFSRIARSSFDPCTAENLAARTDHLAEVKAVCQAQGVPGDFVPSDTWSNLGSVKGFSEGNQNLKNEISNDYTIGFVYSPSSIEGLDFTADYWNFKIDDAIVYFGDDSVDLCYESGDINSPFCSNVNRNSTTNEIDNYYERPINAAVQNRSGIDFDTRYRFAFAGGELTLGLIGTYMIKADYNSSGRPQDLENEMGEYDAATRVKARFSARYQADEYFLGAIVNFRKGTEYDLDHSVEDNDHNNIEDYYRTDLQAGLDFTDDFTVTARIKNVFDVTPVRTPFTYDDGQYFDVYGRTLAVTASYTF